MKKVNLFISFFGVIFLFWGCNSSKYLQFALKEKYYISQNEKEVLKDKNSIATYDKYNQNLEHQVPLEKYLLGENYTIFFGIALNDTPEKINKLYKETQKSEIINNKTEIFKSQNTYSFFIKKDNLFNYRFIYKANKKPNYTVVINLESKDSLLVNTIYTTNRIPLTNLKFEK